MKRGVLADTGPLYAAIDRSDHYHRQAQAELTRLSQDQFDVRIAFPTLFETHTLILRLLGRHTSFRWLKEIRNGSTILAPTLEDYREAYEKVLRFSDQSISLFDALVAVLAGRAKIPVWTYDHHFDVMRSRVWR